VKRYDVRWASIRTISKARVGKKLGALSEADARALRRLITEMYGE
jgi:mRNA-degrading endonuclease toxin of MazEF toxin-antitoxin module